MKNVILLDLDGVLITTPGWKKDDIHLDGYSNFNQETVKNINTLLSVMDADLWLISDRRKGYTVEQFNEFFKNRSIVKELTGMVPVYSNAGSRLEEFYQFMCENNSVNFLLVDDDGSLENLGSEKKKFWVKTNPLIGFNEEKLNEALEKIKHWKQ